MRSDSLHAGRGKNKDTPHHQFTVDKNLRTAKVEVGTLGRREKVVLLKFYMLSKVFLPLILTHCQKTELLHQEDFGKV